ncbi:sensor histidine kinase [Klebsiella pneumoniae]|uniref:sensor histidine kinase n=1 Tax=Klebsiella pneumoniae TaxID=573 RepID=UPI001E2D4D56|nr:ATP-binding protein [Klebsiella pneumoniae]
MLFLEGDRTLVIEVEDTGRGIPKDKLKSIFLPFIRVADGVKVPGFGMGLAIVMGGCQNNEWTYKCQKVS